MEYDIESIKKRKNIHKKIKKITWVFIIIVIYNVILLSISYISNMNISGLFGYKAYAITNDSMEPTIQKGDAIIVKECESQNLKVNDIVTFKRDNEFVTHRITNIENDTEGFRYITKGDNNNIEDSKSIKYEDIQGVQVTTIPFLGNLILIAENSIFIIIVLLIISLIYLYKLDGEEKRENRRRKKQIEDEKFIEKE